MDAETNLDLEDYFSSVQTSAWNGRSSISERCALAVLVLLLLPASGYPR
jgi:hypothetical protein